MLSLIQKLIKLALILLILLNLLLAFSLSQFLNRPYGQESGKKTIEIEKGQGTRIIARHLKKNGLLSNSLFFRLSYSLYYSPRFLMAGEYQFSLPVSPKKIILDLIGGKIMLHPITIPEGLTYEEIASLLIEKQYPIEGSFTEACQQAELVQAFDPKATNLEGYLYPETYFFGRGAKAQELVKAMVEQFTRVFGEKERRRAKELGMSIREVVTLASLIEKETSRPEEKVLVSAVFHNRLRLGMKLDCDPTIIYALKLQNRFDGNLRLSDKSLDSPYNTYLYPGLPPGPICNPGKEAIMAALYPAPVDFLYFVSRGDGSHTFNRSYNEHLKAVKRFQLKNKGHLR
ncbi:MAG TPA: endolytic transglycosylase MltG [Candidatus Aminicenantes bacterium]|nr:MAG: endolytic transglycosylase MltG [Candidatus Aminicenantes bacterium]HEK86241.1 endolytic transglycosylase MltG [Candidatus Aminicenantes bacterium]